eukprot:9037282-Lingulodinium_polyedra.AAC.1
MQSGGRPQAVARAIAGPARARPWAGARVGPGRPPRACQPARARPRTGARVASRRPRPNGRRCGR